MPAWGSSTGRISTAPVRGQLTTGTRRNPGMLRIDAIVPVLTAALAAAVTALHPAAASALEPRLWGEGPITTGAYDFFVALTPDQKTVYFGRATSDFGHW